MSPLGREVLSLKTKILYYKEHTPSNYWFYDYVNSYVRWGFPLNELAAVLQIIRGNRDTFEMIIHIFTVKTYFVIHH